MIVWVYTEEYTSGCYLASVMGVILDLDKIDASKISVQHQAAS